MDPQLGQLRAFFVRLRPWFLRAAALLRLVALAVAMPLLLHGGWLAILIALWLVGCAAGLWRRMIWPWRLALIGDIALVIGAAVKLMDAGNLHLFEYIAGAAAAEVVLLSLGQAALDPGVPVPQ